jgi:hypothetical protein
VLGVAFGRLLGVLNQGGDPLGEVAQFSQGRGG